MQCKGYVAMKATNVKLNMVIVADSRKLAKEMLKHFVSDAREAIETRHRFCVAISHHIPKPFFELLGTEPQSKALHWDKVHLFWADGCCNPPEPGNCNRDTKTDGFISQVGIPSENVHRICPRCRSCQFAASIYEQTIYNVVGRRKNGVPRFDLIILGMGTDAHVASLYPDTYAFFDFQDLVCVVYFMDGRHTRITLTHRVLYAASHIAVVVSGKEKAVILRKVLSGVPDGLRYPVHAIWPVLKKVTWLVDRSAGELVCPCGLLNKDMRGGLRFIEPYRRL